MMRWNLGQYINFLKEIITEISESDVFIDVNDIAFVNYA